MHKNNIYIEGITGGHVQGIAYDGSYMYYSFTTQLVKTDMNGHIVGSVNGLLGHLGCIAFHEGKVYGSLEYKHDAIGASILSRMGHKEEITDGFYIAIFDIEKINRLDMDAERDGIMTAVHLREVLEDYSAPMHRYGCSGIDGLTFAPLPGNIGGKTYLYVAYGIYGDTQRDDNDNQIILRYDTENWDAIRQPLKQSAMHRQGPNQPDSKYFVYTGNTTYGIQNLEYDEKTGYMFAAVYRGQKTQFPNYPMYVIDWHQAAQTLPDGREILSPAEIGKRHESGISGIEFSYGTTGMISLGDGFFYFSRDFHKDGAFGTHIGLYRFDGENFTE